MAKIQLHNETRPAQTFLLSILACSVTLLYICGLSRPVLALQEQNPRALFAVNAPPEAAVPAAAPAPAPVLTLSDKVVNALRAAGDYGAISGVLEGLPDIDQFIQQGTTFFAPDDAVSAGLPYNSSTGMSTLLSYHTASQAYSFQDLLNLKVGDKIATVAPGISILVKNVAKTGYQLDNAIIMNPNLYNNGSVAVHGINAIFFTQFYNTATLGPVPAPPPASSSGTPPGAAASSPPAASSTTTPVAKSHTAPSPNAAARRSLTRGRLFTTASGCNVLTVQLLIALMLLFPL